jgi:hypothetical protein
MERRLVREARVGGSFPESSFAVRARPTTFSFTPFAIFTFDALFTSTNDTGDEEEFSNEGREESLFPL